MFGPEREEARFTPEVEKTIALCALEAANLGEDVIDALRKERYKIMNSHFVFLREYGNNALDISRELENCVEVISEVISRADKILEEKGTSRISQMRKLVARRIFRSSGD